jgi:short-chain fatty acids transporter
MTFSERFEKIFRSVLPSPFALTVVLTIGVLISAILFFRPVHEGLGVHTIDVISMWYKGIWDGPMLVFALQMMLILVLGHALALSEPVENIIAFATRYCTTTAKAAAITTAMCVVAGFVNWGLALIFGAVFARKVAEYAMRKGFRINYPLIAASGYTGMMVWHGGLSGSSLIKAAEPGHLVSLMAGSGVDPASLPEVVSFSETVFSSMNIAVGLALLFILPFSAYSIGKNSIATQYILRHYRKDHQETTEHQTAAEKLDHRPPLALFLGILALFAAGSHAAISMNEGEINFVDPNFINIILLGIGLIAHGTLSKFNSAIEHAASGAAAILIQFPLYFGIMGVMKSTGMVSAVSDFFVDISTPGTYPIFTFISASLVNIVIPSGGGQWMIQGPVIIESAVNMNLPLGKNILAMAYGDQITNMLQPFWALPLLAITGLKARDILPYTLYFMVIGGAIYLAALWLF